MPVSNERGPIADSYDELQSIQELKEARDRFSAIPGSMDSVNRTVLQAAEIAILNVGDLLRRATADVQMGGNGSAREKISWATGFHRLLVELSLIPHQTAPLSFDAPGGLLSITDSPAYTALENAIGRFDETVIDKMGAELEAALENPSAHADVATIAHLARIASHESAIWERNLLSVPVGQTPPDYSEYIAADLLQKAVCGFSLAGDTFFMQFRGVHQISEVIAMECCERIRDAVQATERNALPDAVQQLFVVNSLLRAITVSLIPMVDNLTTSAYHEIRENLGLTSGSHSDAIRRQLFQDLYPEIIRAALAEKYLTYERPASRMLAAELFQMRSLIERWRDLHLHFPRNNLGGVQPVPTRSLVGSADAVATVQQMQSDASRRDPLRDLAVTLKLEGHGFPALLSAYSRSERSLDQYLLQCTGRITQRRFPQVQDRTGYFSKQPHLGSSSQEQI